MTDPIADLLTRIRNAIQAKHEDLSVPSSKLKVEIARILKEEGYIKDYKVVKEDNFDQLKILLKYTPERTNVITSLQKVSKPGLRKYVGKDDVPSVLNGLGMAIISTSSGVMTDRDAREKGVGGEVLCTVY